MLVKYLDNDNAASLNPDPITVIKLKLETCFPSDAKLTLKNGKSVKMSELKRGDKVQTGDQGKNIQFLIITL